MRLIYPADVDATWLAATNVAAVTVEEWNAGEAYTNEIVRVSSDDIYHIYQCVTAHSGQNPTTDDGTYWLDLGYENRWKFRDLYVGDPVVKTGGTMTYSFTAQAEVSAIAFFGVVASSIQVQVIDDSEVTVFDETADLANPNFVYDWITWRKQGESYSRRKEVVFRDLPCPAGYSINVTITNGASTVYLGQMILGEDFSLGMTLSGTTVEKERFGKVIRDDFGRITNWTKRSSAKIVKYNVTLNTSEANRSVELLGELSETPVVFYVEPELDQYGVTQFGYYEDFRITLDNGPASRAVIETTGLV